jgi:hypothetical protein
MSIILPEPRFPNALDDYSSLLLVHNRSEASVIGEIPSNAKLIAIIPRFDMPEKFSAHGGYASIESVDGTEDIFYGRGHWLYKAGGGAVTLTGVYVPSGDELLFDGPIVPDAMSKDDIGRNVLVFGGTKFTVAGTASVGGIDVDFSVSGNGRHGSGAVFSFSRPDLFQVSESVIDVDAGTLLLVPMGFGWTAKSVVAVKAVVDEFGKPSRRIASLSMLRRGLRGTPVLTHASGAMVRSFIMAEHHMLAARAALLVQERIGIDMSEDRASLDFRLRDLDDICVEGEDWPCPEIDFYYRPVEQETGGQCVVIDEYQFNLRVNGDYNSFGIFFGDGSGVTDDLQPIHQYAPSSRVEPSAFASNEDCRVSTAFYEEQADIGEIPEIPDVLCPEIVIPDIPAIPDTLLPQVVSPESVQIECPECPTAVCGDCTTGTTLPSVWISVPTSVFISIPQFTFPTLEWPSITISYSPPTIPSITVQFTVNVTFPPEAGPCFALVPCGGYCHGG